MSYKSFKLISLMCLMALPAQEQAGQYPYFTPITKSKSLRQVTTKKKEEVVLKGAFYGSCLLYTLTTFSSPLLLPSTIVCAGLLSTIKSFRAPTQVRSFVEAQEDIATYYTTIQVRNRIDKDTLVSYHTLQAATLSDLIDQTKLSLVEVCQGKQNLEIVIECKIKHINLATKGRWFPTAANKSDPTAFELVTLRKPIHLLWDKKHTRNRPFFNPRTPAEYNPKKALKKLESKLYNKFLVLPDISFLKYLGLSALLLPVVFVASTVTAAAVFVLVVHPFFV